MNTDEFELLATPLLVRYALQAALADAQEVIAIKGTMVALNLCLEAMTRPAISWSLNPPFSVQRVEPPDIIHAPLRYRQALEHGTSRAPKPISQATQRFANCLRINDQHPAQTGLECTLRMVGELTFGRDRARKCYRKNSY